MSGADWMEEALRLNNARRAVRYGETKAEGQAYLVERRDLYDAFDRDAGVYFVGCADEAAVDAVIAHARSPEGGNDPILGIYSLRAPLDGQGPGLTPAAWRAGGRCYGLSEGPPL